MPVLKVKKNGVWEIVAGINGHSHTMSDITDFPSTLLEDVDQLKMLVGDTSVSEQISAAISSLTNLEEVAF